VLVADTTNVEALTETGWLTFSAASVQKNATLVAVAVADLRKAVTLAPNNPATHLYYGIVAASTPGNLATARAQFRAFLALKPSVAQRAIAEPYLRTLHLA
jgi:Flp pilus assembly protein TadD